MAPRRPRAQAEEIAPPPSGPEPALVWLVAKYAFHTFSYRDPRAAFSAAIGLPVVSPTTVLLGIVSTLFSIGEADAARRVLNVIHQCSVVVDSPDAVIFFRAFHQLRRYISPTKGPTHRAGLTNINQGTREYGIPDGAMTIYVGAPESISDAVTLALRNRDHVGTHDSLCSLIGEVGRCEEPSAVVYRPIEQWPGPEEGPVTVVTLSRFRQFVKPAVAERWWMAGGDETELVPFIIRGEYRGTSRGKVFLKAGPTSPPLRVPT